MTLTMTTAISACLCAFGLGYCAGHLLLLWRRSIEALD